MLVPVTFGDFKPNEISQLINSKDPSGLNADIDSYLPKKVQTLKLQQHLKLQMNLIHQVWNMMRFPIT